MITEAVCLATTEDQPACRANLHKSKTEQLHSGQNSSSIVLSSNVSFKVLMKILDILIAIS